MIPPALADRLVALERRILKEEQALISELHVVKQRHREQIAGSLRSRELEDVRRELRKIARESLLATGVPPAPELLAEARAAEQMLSELLAALTKAAELGATRVDVGDLRVAVEHRLTPLRIAIAKATGR
jgi:hypothetical protein